MDEKSVEGAKTHLSPKTLSPSPKLFRGPWKQFLRAQASMQAQASACKAATDGNEE